MFENKTSINLPENLRPQLIVVIDTEEEFDWSADPDRDANQVTAMEHIERAQSIFREYGIRPCYVVDYPVATQPEGNQLLKKYLQQGQCEIGVHLHPWVNPPYEEHLSRENMYPGNLPRELELAKLATLQKAITGVFGAQPVAYKAGRYGFGPNTAEILSELGFDIDLSVCPPLDARHDGGPDYRDYDARPFWFGQPERRILEIPCTGAFVGWAGRMSRTVYDWANAFRQFGAHGLLSRLRMVDRLMLSPEGYSTPEHIRLTRALLSAGVRTFTWSFHSPSLVPGHTTYVQSQRDLNEFLDRFRRYFDFFFQDLNGEASSPTQIRTLMESMT